MKERILKKFHDEISALERELKFEFSALALGGIRQLGEEIERLPHLLDRFCHCRSRLGTLARLLPIGDRLFDQTRIPEMVREDFRLRPRRRGQPLLQHVRDPGVQLAALAAQQRAVRRILHQRVFEQEIGIGRFTAPEHQPGGDQPVERRSQLAVAAVCDGGEQIVGELPTDGRADLRYFLPDRADTVEPCHQRRLQSGRHCEPRQRRSRAVPSSMRNIARSATIPPTRTFARRTAAGCSR